ncbi:endonuclease/exonuclease/phosphatase family protein [Pseudochrobactrum saccharolyticum]|uniref:endonuclease/exonuclease/phosphatase family protein n=1 Tax=Pseudochrobactrum saccharolyticum TaxID=354352 RepID=UPI0027952540|nr:endonuclease/exonuclease/phosphatase family protein [Pseudochrobactrum saccharolyticum]
MTEVMTVETMIRAQVAVLDVPSHEERQSITQLDKTMAAHDAKLVSMECMTRVETGGQAASTAPLAFPFNVTAWNLERCMFPEESAAKMLAEKPAVALLTEMDNGMARTAQKNMTAEVARHMDMEYAYGVEFIELGLGSEIEHSFCKDDFNEKGFHGNALMSSVPMQRIFVQRLAGERLWFFNGGDQPRLGERNAIGAVIETVDGPFLAVSVHLESASSAAYREKQVAQLIDALEEEFGTMPMLIGGDLNTGNHAEGDFEAEGLFRVAAERGFTRHSGALDQMTTRPSLITRWPDRAMKLDWFLSRGLNITESRIISSLDDNQRPLSDHDLIICRVDGFSAA